MSANCRYYLSSRSLRRPCKRVLATNGEYASEADAAVRTAESRSVLAALGVPAEQIYFLGYPDTGMPYEESFLRQLYDGCRVSASRWGRTETWRPDGQDFHFMRSGCHSTYTAASVLRDLSDVLALVNPDTVYVTPPATATAIMTPLGRFTTQAVAAMENPPALYYYLIHADRTDIWPERDAERFRLAAHGGGSSAFTVRRGAPSAAGWFSTRGKIQLDSKLYFTGSSSL